MIFKELPVGTPFHWVDSTDKRNRYYRKIAQAHAVNTVSHKVTFVPADAEVEANVGRDAPAAPAARPRRKR